MFLPGIWQFLQGRVTVYCLSVLDTVFQVATFLEISNLSTDLLISIDSCFVK